MVIFNSYVKLPEGISPIWSMKTGFKSIHIAWSGFPKQKIRLLCEPNQYPKHLSQPCSSSNLPGLPNQGSIQPNRGVPSLATENDPCIDFAIKNADVSYVCSIVMWVYQRGSISQRYNSQGPDVYQEFGIELPGFFIDGQYTIQILPHRGPFLWANGSVGHMGVSENSVPLNPMVNDHYPY